MTNNFPCTELTFVVLNKSESDFSIDIGETWKFINSVDDANDAYLQLVKSKISAQNFGHEIINLYLDGQKFNAKAC